MTMPSHRSIVVIDCHPVLATGLARLITRRCSGVRTLSFGSVAAALPALRTSRPALVMLDALLLGDGGTPPVPALRALVPHVPIVILTRPGLAVAEAHADELGPIYFVDRDCRDRKLLRQIALPGDAAPAPARPRRARRVDLDARKPLSPRQREIVQLLEAGHSTREIADAMKVSSETIKTQLHIVYEKLGVANRMQAVLRFRAETSEPEDA
jgi:DNA-binding NarL/FixJ family response regulator